VNLSEPRPGRDLETIVSAALTGKAVSPDQDKTEDQPGPTWGIDVYDAGAGYSLREPYAAVKEFRRRDAASLIRDLEDAGLVCMGARQGYVFIRHEYPEQAKAVQEAIDRARNAVPEAFKVFELEVFVSPGRYICGEQTALLEVLEDRRAQPRPTPPEIEQQGLF